MMKSTVIIIITIIITTTTATNTILTSMGTHTTSCSNTIPIHMVKPSKRAARLANQVGKNTDHTLFMQNKDPMTARSMPPLSVTITSSCHQLHIAKSWKVTATATALAIAIAITITICTRRANTP